MIEAVIFDMDGVIFDTERLMIRCWEEIGIKYGLKDIKPLCISCIGTNYELCRQKFNDYYGGEHKYEEYDRKCFDLYFEKIEKEGLPLKEGVKELLDYLKTRRIKIGLASSNMKDVIKSHLTGSGLIGYFDVIVSGEEIEKSKPEPDIYLAAANKLGFENKDGCFAIEDSYNGVISASRAGLKTIMVPDILYPTEEIESFTAGVLNDLAEVKKFFSENYPI